MAPLVLVVDDQPTIREVLADFLAEEGYEVRSACDGQEALEVAAEERPDVVVSDIRMPRVDGLELIRRLRVHGVDVPVVLISAHYHGADIPGVRFIPKPFDLDQIAAAIDDALARTA